jgi:uncharacterized damage-inducible protein DinB
MTPSFTGLHLRAAAHFIAWNRERIERCLDELSEEEVWQRPNGNSNSVGNQILHLCGNIRQWVGSGLGGAPDDRHREAEFSTTAGVTKVQLMHRLAVEVDEALRTLESQTASSLVGERPVQAYVHDGALIVMHVVEHMSYHTGQIVFWTKLLRDKDLRFYAGDDLGATR